MEPRCPKLAARAVLAACWARSGPGPPRLGPRERRCRICDPRGPVSVLNLRWRSVRTESAATGSARAALQDLQPSRSGFSAESEMALGPDRVRRLTRETAASSRRTLPAPVERTRSGLKFSRRRDNEPNFLVEEPRWRTYGSADFSRLLFVRSVRF